MTIEEFNAIKFRAGMQAIINGKVKNVISVDFNEKKIGLEIEDDDENIDWVRCENLELVKL